jgi:hypothetical protein
MKATSHSFALAAYLPIPKFIGVTAEVHAVLTARLFHHCLDRVLDSLKAAERSGALMSDPNGRLRMMHTPLVAWIADRPEQLLLSGVSNSHSAISLATTNQFGDAFPHPPRTRQHTLSALDRVLQKSPDPWNLPLYIKACAVEGLNGVHELFWRNWGSADPSLFLTPEALHQWHKFFYDHPLKWIINIMTGPELDFRLSVLQPRIGARHWSKGVSKLKQCTGREHRDLETQLVAVASGAVPFEVLCTVRALVDFIFQAQNLLHCEETLHALCEALREFHHFKQAVISHGGRWGKRGPINHFNIPKLETFQHVVRSIRAMGAAYQWTSDITERCHITHAKTPYRRSNHRDFHKQCCRFLDRDEKRCFFHLYVLLKAGQASLKNEVWKEENAIMSQYPESTWLAEVLPNETPVGGPRTARNFFANKASIRSQNDSVSLYVNKSPHLSSITIDDAACHFNIPDLRASLGDFYSGKTYADRGGKRLCSPSTVLPFQRLHVWYNFKIQYKSAQDPTVICPASTVQALPPSDKLPYGRCDAVLVSEESDISLTVSDRSSGMAGL